MSYILICFSLQDTIIANAGPGHWNDPDMVRDFKKSSIIFPIINFKVMGNQRRRRGELN